MRGQQARELLLEGRDRVGLGRGEARLRLVRQDRAGGIGGLEVERTAASLVSKVSVRTPAASKVRMWSRPSLSMPAMTRFCPEVGTPEPSPQDINRRSNPY